MNIEENRPLAPLTTFHIGGLARYFCTVTDQAEALQALDFARGRVLPVFILGGGSNILVSDEGFAGLVIKVESKGLEVAGQTDRTISLRVGAGEVWDEVAGFAAAHDWWGVENLSHIPGSTGAIAVQNVGAYGQEAKNVIASVEVLDSRTGQMLTLDRKECGFAYRRSIFNSSQKGRYLIFYVNFVLSPQPQPQLSYRDLRERFAGRQPGLAEIRQAVTEIRDRKFPFPVEARLGNAGSFFKNPTLDAGGYRGLAEQLAVRFGSEAAARLDRIKFEEGSAFKVPAAFLIDLCGLKNLRRGGAAINAAQPLVLLNETGEASAADVLALAGEVKDSVYRQTGINLAFEPELIGFT
ncbi:MAG TPA: UDP-N-acetylmuramate dehydrogenase [Patescibacteria group bacterium]|nr:UDP-N-acetylmuramate dehydrogenase [Patescibacteria group bacterium]